MSDEKFEALEHELTKLRPAAAPPRLQQAIAGALETHAPAAEPSQAVPGKLIRLSLWTSWAVTGAAAAVAIVALARLESSRAEVPAPSADAVEHARGAEAADTFRAIPVRSGEYLYSRRDEGLIMLENGEPARRVRYQFLDTLELTAPDGSGRINVTSPREEIRVVPIRTL